MTKHTTLTALQAALIVLMLGFGSGCVVHARAAVPPPPAVVVAPTYYAPPRAVVRVSPPRPRAVVRVTAPRPPTVRVRVRHR